MTKVLITGFSGFVAKHFVDRLMQDTDSYSVLGIDVNAPGFPLENAADASID